MKQIRLTVIKNVIANALRGGASALVALALPHFLTHALDHDRFAAWALILQIAAYSTYLDFGLQTAVARYLAQAIELDDKEAQDRLVNTAIALLSLCGVAALVLIGAVLAFLPHIFHQIPSTLVGELRGGTAILAVSAALLLPLSTYTGILIGLHRNELPALAIGGTRLLGAVLVIICAHYTHSLVALASCLAFCNLAGGVMQYIIARVLLPINLNPARASRAMAKELANYCTTLMVWSFAMFMVSGLDVTLVGYFDFKQLSYYSIATTLILFFTGINNAVMNALLAPIAAMQARREIQRIEGVVLSSTRLTSLINMAFVVVVFLFGQPLVSLWVGPSYAAGSMLYLKILAVAQALRLVGSAFAMALTATGLQKHAIVCVSVEGITNLGTSVWFGHSIGASGVAWGTLIAALIALPILIGHVMKPKQDLVIHQGRFLWQGVVQPILVFSPLLAWILVRH